MTHGQTVVGEVGGDPQASFDGVRLGLHAREQRVLGGFALGLGAHVQVLCLEGCQPPQAVGNLPRGGRGRRRRRGRKRKEEEKAVRAQTLKQEPFKENVHPKAASNI